MQQCIRHGRQQILYNGNEKSYAQARQVQISNWKLCSCSCECEAANVNETKEHETRCTREKTDEKRKERKKNRQENCRKERPQHGQPGSKREAARRGTETRRRTRDERPEKPAEINEKRQENQKGKPRENNDPNVAQAASTKTWKRAFGSLRKLCRKPPNESGSSMRKSTKCGQLLSSNALAAKARRRPLLK